MKLLTVAQWCLLLLTAAVIAWTDHRTRRIPNRLLLAMLLIRAGSLCACGILTPALLPEELAASLCGFLLGGVQCCVFVPLFRDRIGAGDHKLLWTLAICLGTRAYCCILIGMLPALLFWQWSRGRKNSGETVAFAPFVLFGMAVTALLIVTGITAV